jgi:hypothetical protein
MDDWHAQEIARMEDTASAQLDSIKAAQDTAQIKLAKLLRSETNGDE